MSQPLPPGPDELALARYRVLSSVWSQQRLGRPLPAAVCLVARELHVGADGRLFTVSRRTLYRWLKAYREGGLDGLKPRSRRPLRGSVALRGELLDFLLAERAADPAASIPELIRRARERGLARAEESVHRSTVRRAFVRLGVASRTTRRAQVPDARRFAYPERLQMVLVDGKHFRAGPQRLRRVALYLLDDATRFGLDVVVAPSENTSAFLLMLHRALLQWGRFDALYCDHGPAFAGGDTTAVLAHLDIRHVLGKVGYPEGRGKIERFNRSADARLLRSLAGAEQVDPDCGALTVRLRHDLLEVYNHTPHGALKGKSPHQRFFASERRLRPMGEAAQLAEAFSVPLTRHVSADHVVSVDGTAFEVPRGYAGQPITLHRRLLESGRLYLNHRGDWLRLHPVDPHANATSPRGTSDGMTPLPEPDPRPTASTLAYERALGSVLGPDGGFTEPDEPTDTE